MTANSLIERWNAASNFDVFSLREMVHLTGASENTFRRYCRLEAWGDRPGSGPELRYGYEPGRRTRAGNARVVVRKGDVIAWVRQMVEWWTDTLPGARASKLCGIATCRRIAALAGIELPQQLVDDIRARKAA